jgi:hypothetical protein
MPKKLTTEEFIKRSQEKHGDKYDYSKSIYVNKNTPVCIICPKHGEFWQKPCVHWIGCGCQKCADSGVQLTTEEFIEKAKKVHGDKYDYSKTIYTIAHNKVIITCPKHGDFEQEASSHLCGKGCPLCAHGGKVYKPYGYWDNKELCIAEGKKYHNKSEFVEKNPAAYRFAVKNGWINEITKNYNNKIMYASYEDKIHLIYIYLFENYNTVYIGRTVNLKHRDAAHRNGTNHTNGIKYFDSIYKFAMEHNIDVPEPMIVESGLNAEESQDREGYWVNYYKEQNFNVLNKAKTGKGSSSLGARIVWTYEKCKETAANFTSKYEFKAAHVGAYNACIKNKWINDFFKTNKNKPKGYWDDFENCKKETEPYATPRDFRLSEPFGYNACRKHGWLDILFNIKNLQK